MHSRWSFTVALSSSTQHCSFWFISPNWTLSLLLMAKQSFTKTCLYIFKKPIWFKGLQHFSRLVLQKEWCCSQLKHPLTEIQFPGASFIFAFRCDQVTSWAHSICLQLPALSDSSKMVTDVDSFSWTLITRDSNNFAVVPATQNINQHVQSLKHTQTDDFNKMTKTKKTQKTTHNAFYLQWKWKEKANFKLVEQKSEDNEAETGLMIDDAFTSKCFISSDWLTTNELCLKRSGRVTLFPLIYL